MSERQRPCTRVEGQEVGAGRHATLDLVDVHDLEAVAAPRVLVRALRRAEGGAQGEPADAAHAVDAHTQRAGGKGVMVCERLEARCTEEANHRPGT
jgi:hypothetical protein